MSFLSLFKKKQNSIVKLNINIKQKDDIIMFLGEFGKDYLQVLELWLISRDNSAKQIKVAEQRPSHKFNLNVSLSYLHKTLCNIDCTETYDWYFKVRCYSSDLSERLSNSTSVTYELINGKEYASYLMRCGRFQNTSIDEFTVYSKDDASIVNYITAKGSLSLIVNGETAPSLKVQIDKIKSKQGKLFLTGKMFSGSLLITNPEVFVLGRRFGLGLTSSKLKLEHLTKETSERYGLNRYVYRATIDLVEMNNQNLVPEDIYDLFFKIKYNNGQETMLRVGKPTNRVKLLMKDTYSLKSVEATVINPYFTFKLENLSIETYNYPIKTYKYLLKIQRFSRIIRLFNKHKKVWLVGERTYKAQDTGYSFFKYMRLNYPEKNVYYVIDKDSPEKSNVERYGNILEYKSKEHIWNTIISNKVISSHHPDYLFPLRTSSFTRKVKADKVFLQHGVMGTKNMVANYGKNTQNFNTDLFMVSSKFEKEMIVNDFGYESKNVFITGLSRFDSLFKSDINLRRQLLIIPTWRDWIVSDQAFIESEYFERYRQLVKSEKLLHLSEEFNFDILLCLHPNMQQFSSYFESDVVKVINQGEVDVQSLIKASAVMLTDYSSVGFDFSFLYKPVIYYQFDRERFIGTRPSHLDLDNDLPGRIEFELDELLTSIQYYAENNFMMENKYKIRADKFIKYRDLKSSERIYQVVQQNTVKKSVKDNPKIKLIVKALYNKFRKSDMYFPVMKIFYKYGRYVIPVDKNLILFESGIGKQFGDSPKDIYEEILKQKLNYKKVWVYNKHHRFLDPNTKRIQRLTPHYYYYLLRAGYWVNNQNFPTYIKKRSKTTYLQTWHGTPLKKMLYDIKEVKGRSDDYVQRVGQAVQYWDYLISPSAYASHAFRSAFKYKNKIIESGYPRNDIFFKKDKDALASEVLNRLHLPVNKKVILYAPTFRDNKVSNKNRFLFDIEMDLNKMRKELGEDYIVLLRMHVVIVSKLEIDDSLKSFVFNVSNYPDIQELQLISDILITDYSSVMFDYANTGKPILFFTYDLADYRDNIRGFYMDFENEAPGPLLFNTDEIIKSIVNIDQTIENYKEKYLAFHEKYCSLEDGKASKRVVEKIFKGKK